MGQLAILLLLLWNIRSAEPLAASSSQPSQRRLDDPTPADAVFASWATKHGIFAPSIACLTTPQSVGGRGLFAKTTIGTGNVVASIPHELILSSSQNKELWAADLTSQVLDLDPLDPRTEWVASWSGGGCTTWEDVAALLSAGDDDNDDNDDDDDADVLLLHNDNQNRKLQNQYVQREIERRLALRRQTWDTAAAVVHYQLHPETDLALYALVCSRACFLGPSWPSRTPDRAAAGIVPLFDMLNHFPARTNVELVSVGTAFGQMSPDAPKPSNLHDQDMLLVATQSIEYGEELFTEYLKEHVDDTDAVVVENKARKLVQWGFL